MIMFSSFLHDLLESPVGDLLHQIVRGLLQGDQAGSHPKLNCSGVRAKYEPGQAASAKAQVVLRAARIFHAYRLPAEVHDEVELESVRNLTIGRSSEAA